MWVECWKVEPLQSCVTQDSFVDAEALTAIWPAEFDDVRVLVVQVRLTVTASLFSVVDHEPSPCSQLQAKGNLQGFSFFGPRGSWSELDMNGHARQFNGKWRGRDVILLNQVRQELGWGWD